MVEVNELLHVSAEDFFAQIAKSVAYDAQESTGKKVRPSHLRKGFSYTKKMKNKTGKKGEVLVTITEYKVPVCYKAKFESFSGINTISYEIEALEDGIGVSYKEDFSSDSKATNLNGKLVGALYKNRAKKKAVKLLRSIENYIQEQEDVSKQTEGEE